MSDTYKAVSKAQGMSMFCTACYSVRLSEKGVCPGVGYCKMLDTVIASWLKRGLVDLSTLDRADEAVAKLKKQWTDGGPELDLEALVSLIKGYEYLKEKYYDNRNETGTQEGNSTV